MKLTSCKPRKVLARVPVLVAYFNRRNRDCRSCINRDEICECHCGAVFLNLWVPSAEPWVGGYQRGEAPSPFVVYAWSCSWSDVATSPIRWQEALFGGAWRGNVSASFPVHLTWNPLTLRCTTRVSKLQNAPCRTSWTGMEGLLVLLRRLPWPSWLGDLCEEFGRSTAVLGTVFNHMLSWLCENLGRCYNQPISSHKNGLPPIMDTCRSLSWITTGHYLG